MIPSLVQLKITSGICSAAALGLTSFRLFLRRDRYWWDDACAFLSLIFLCLQIASVFLHLPNPQVLTRIDNVAAYYIMAATFYSIIWTARLAILYSVIRIDPNPHSRKWLHRIAYVFILVLCVMIAQLFWVCEPLNMRNHWKLKATPQCPLDNQVAICQLITDVISDVLLIAAPLRLIRRMSAGDSTRRRLMIIFSTSIVTTIVSLVHAAFIFSDAGIKVVIAAIVEDTFSLIVCNLPVVVTFGLRQLGKPEEETDHTNASTFGWRVATRKTWLSGGTRTTGPATASTNSDTAVTTVNLRDFTTNAVITNPTLTQIERAERRERGRGRAERTVDMSEAGVGLASFAEGQAKQQKSIVWFAAEGEDKGRKRDEDEESR